MSQSTPTTDVEQVKGLLDWALERGISLSTVQVGACRVDLATAPVQAGTATLPPKQDPRLDGIYKTFGSEIWDDVARDLNLPAGLEPVVKSQ